MRTYNGDLIARLRWLSEHDRAGLLHVLATVGRDALTTALRLAGPDPAAPTGLGPAHNSTAGHGTQDPP